MRLRAFRTGVVLETLLAIYQNPGVYVREVYKLVSGSPNAVLNAIKDLKKLNLIRIEREKSGTPRRKFLYPTEKGKKIGELLAKIDEILGE
ncbi:MarR family transcriptional regulator [Candidatus Bathyarchaeota archaeon]|nr:MAG: MarR family transcriptional regulator [Candidatus Bathyarchaeota archaeon]